MFIYLKTFINRYLNNKRALFGLSNRVLYISDTIILVLYIKYKILK